MRDAVRRRRRRRRRKRKRMGAMCRRRSSSTIIFLLRGSSSIGQAPRASLAAAAARTRIIPAPVSGTSSYSPLSTSSSSHPDTDHSLVTEQLLHRLEQQTNPADHPTYSRLLHASGGLRNLSWGRRVHAHIVRSGLQGDKFLAASLVTMYGKCGSLQRARRIFDEMHPGDVVLWNAMIGAYVEHGDAKEALRLFKRMQKEAIQPNNFTFVSVLSACASLKALADGNMIHASIVERRVESDVAVGVALINMYGKCGSVEDARRMFDRMHYRDVVSWTAMITAYVQHGQYKEALQLFQRMQLEGVKPNQATFATVLSACARLAALGDGKLIHARVVESKLESNLVVGNALVNMYVRCRSVDDARRIFDRMHQRDVVSWTTMIAAYARLGQGKEALQLYKQMLLEGVKPDERTFTIVLSACASLAALAEGKVIHAYIVVRGLEANVFVGNALVSMYAKCCRLEDARKMFDRMHQRNVVSWNAIIAAYTQHGRGKEAIQLFQQMQQEGMKPNERTFASLLSACASFAALAEGKLIHACIVESGFGSNAVLGNALVRMYAKCGRMEDAQKMFDSLNHRNLVSWTAMITAYAQHGRGKEALQFFRRMQLEGVKPDKSIFVCVLSACDSPAALPEGKRIHACIVESGLESDAVVWRALTGMYAKCRSVADAEKQNASMGKGSRNTMIAADVQQ